MDGPGILRMASISKLSQNEVQSDRRTGQTEKTAAHRRRPLRVLFVHRDADGVDCCVQELEKAQFTVGADVVFTLAQCEEQLRLESYEVVVVQYPSPSSKGPQGFEFRQHAL